MQTMRMLAIGLILGLCMAPGLMAQSQATTGVIEGTISDESGAVLPGVSVTLVNTATDFEKVLVTDSQGRFRGVLLPLGPYKVTAALEGFSTLVQEGIQLTVGRTINTRLTMQVSATSEEIFVTSVAPLSRISSWTSATSRSLHSTTTPNSSAEKRGL